MLIIDRPAEPHFAKALVDLNHMVTTITKGETRG